MKDRLEQVEKNILALSNSQVETVMLTKMIGENVSKLTESIENLTSFETETATHREHDNDFKRDVRKKLTEITKNREDDFSKVYKSIRNETEKRKELETKHTLLDVKTEQVVDDIQEIKDSQTKRGDRWRNGFVGSIFSGITGLVIWLTTK